MDVRDFVSDVVYPGTASPTEGSAPERKPCGGLDVFGKVIGRLLVKASKGHFQGSRTSARGTGESAGRSP